MRVLRLEWWLFIAYVVALLFGIAGISVALQQPELWAHLELGRTVYAFGMRWGGVLYIVLGAAAVFVYGWKALGPKKILSFFGLSVTISLAAELIGTSTGWPFGNYSYTYGLGPKVLDRVPFTIPLSWFTVGLASWLLATQVSARWLGTARPLFTIPFGVWLLVVWDLVLDPAMAHESMQARFWVWHQAGSYYGMPVINFFGWALTGAAFITASRFAWRSDPPPTVSPTLPFAVYSANLFFAAALCLAVGLWGPVAIATLLGLLPASLAILPQRHPYDRMHHPVARASTPCDPAMSEKMAWLTLRLLARVTLTRRRLVVSGLDFLPATGPLLLVPQHIHHLDDGRVLLAGIPRQLRFIVALDWVPTQSWRRLMEWLCQLAGWPVIIRPTEITRPGLLYSPAESRQRLFGGLREALARLLRGEALVIFPEAYPIIDPHLPGRRVHHTTVHLGALWLAGRAARTLTHPIPVVPIRIRYSGSVIVLDIQPALSVGPRDSFRALANQLAQALQTSSEGNVETARAVSAGGME